MDFQSLKSQIEQSRRFELEVQGATFSLRLPSEHAWRLAVESNRDANGRPMEARALRALLDGAVSGWRGVTARHFLSEAPEDAVEFSAQARAELLDCRQDIADELGDALVGRRRAEREKREQSRKN